MKKASILLLIMAAVSMFSGTASAFYVHDQTDAVNIIPNDVTAASATTNDIQVRKYHGQGKLVLDAEAQGSGITNDISVQASALASGVTETRAGDDDLKLNLSTSGSPTLAVKFTQVGARQVKYIDLILKRTGAIANDKVLTLSLRSAGTTTPPLTILATAATVSCLSIDTAYQPVRFTLTTPYLLSDSTAYWISLTSSYTASDTLYVSWHVATVASGGTAATEVANVWTADTTQDPKFKIYQYNFQDVVTFTQVGNAASLQSKAIDLDSSGTAVRAVSTVAGGSSTGAVSLTLIAPKRP
jgi:hypothetical protein